MVNTLLSLPSIKNIGGILNGRNYFAKQKRENFSK
jgi:hypothetical protein